MQARKNVRICSKIISRIRKAERILDSSDLEEKQIAEVLSLLHEYEEEAGERLAAWYKCIPNTRGEY